MDECCGYIVIDVHTGDSICSGCGIVKDNRLINDLPIVEKNAKQQQQQHSYSCSADEFVNLCDKKHISPNVIELALEINASAEHKQERSIADLAYSLYIACQKLHACRSIKEISDILYLDSKSKQQFAMKCKQDQIRPSHLNQRVCSELGIQDYKTVSRISNEADLIFDQILLSHSPQSVLAGTIMKTAENLQLDISHKTIANKCQVSLACARRVFKRMVSAQRRSF